MKLKSRIHLYSSALFAILLLAANVTVYLIFSNMSIDRELEQIKEETIQASEAIRGASNRIAREELLRAYLPLDGMLRIVEEDEQNNALLVTTSSATSLSEQQAVYYPKRQVEQVIIEGKSYGFVSVPIIGADGDVANIQATESMEELMQLLQMLRIVLMSVFAAVMIPVIISSGVLGTIIMRPIAAMTRTMSEITRSGKFIRLNQTGHSKDELVKMGETFNEMIGLLEGSFAKQEQFVSNASHELKTPLTIIESYASLLKRRGMDRPELFLESVEAIHSEAIRMKEMTEQLLLLAKPHRHWELTMNHTELLPLTEQAVAGFRRAYGRELMIEGSNEEPISAYTDADKLKQLLFILLDNARKYSSEIITVQVGMDKNHSYIQVMDHGIGIAEDELSLVFDRFYRVDKARNRGEEQAGGAGLGLSLAREISVAIGAKITLESVVGVGTTATIQLSKDKSADAPGSQ
ncbi:MAG: sensor histidine kinase [Candidatus Pristimantibacillus sp.]